MKLTLELEEDEDIPEGQEQSGSPSQVKVQEHWVQMWVLDGIPLRVLAFRWGLVNLLD